MTAAALVIFKEAGLEWAVVEVGIGGRLDSTNVVHGEIAVVTNIELEHTEILGSTRAAIAREKVGILKPGAILVTTLGPDDEAGKVLQARADALRCPVARAPVDAAATIEDGNAALAGLALDQLGRAGVSARREPIAGAAVGAMAPRRRDPRRRAPARPHGAVGDRRRRQEPAGGVRRRACAVQSRRGDARS